MRLKLRHFLLALCVCVNRGGIPAEGLPDPSFYEFSTPKYRITMRVSFSAPYEGQRLVVYRTTEPPREDCLAMERGVSGCIEKFVGSVAVVLFRVDQASDGHPAAASIREVVTVVAQSQGLPYRPAFVMIVKLLHGLGTDLQVFGYDETFALPADRSTERETAKAAWRHYRQELYMDKDQQPFAVIEWQHTTSRIQILRVNGSPSSLSKSGFPSPATAH